MMNEHSPEVGSQEPEKGNDFEFDQLGFEELRMAKEEINRLATISFIETEDGFRNANGDGIWIKEKNGVYKASGISPVLVNIHTWIVQHQGESVLARGSTDRIEVMQAARAMIIETGGRIIQ